MKSLKYGPILLSVIHSWAINSFKLNSQTGLRGQGQPWTDYRTVPVFIDGHFPGSQSLSFIAMKTEMKFVKLSRPFSYDFLVRALTKIRFQIGAIQSQFDAALWKPTWTQTVNIIYILHFHSFILEIINVAWIEKNYHQVDCHLSNRRLIFFESWLAVRWLQTFKIEKNDGSRRKWSGIWEQRHYNLVLISVFITVTTKWNKNSVKNSKTLLNRRFWKLWNFLKHCDFYFIEILRNVFQKYSGQTFYKTLRNVSNRKKIQCFMKHWTLLYIWKIWQSFVEKQCQIFQI